MSGRGNLLRALKGKKEKERSLSPSTHRKLLPEHAASPSQQQPSQLGEAATQTGAINVQTQPPPLAAMGRGRGQFSYLTQTRPPPAQIKPEEQVSSDQYLCHSDEKAARPISKRISPAELLSFQTQPQPILPKPSTLNLAQTTENVTISQSLLKPQPPEGSSTETTKQMSRGRGVMMLGRGIGAKKSPRDESPARQTVPPQSSASTLQQTASIEAKLSKLTLVEEVIKGKPASTPVKSDQGEIQTVMTSSGGGGAGASGARTGSGGVAQSTQLTELTGSRSYERAEEELRGVELVKRKSPVRRMGNSGEKSDFVPNYVKLVNKNMHLYQYVVYFNPPIDSKQHRIKMVYVGLSEVIGPARLFDGVTLYLPILLKDKVSVFNVKRKTVNNTEQDVEIRIQLTKILPPEQMPPPVFNIIFKNIMKQLEMTRIGQHYFSPARQIDVNTQNLQIWPGYTTAVHEYEDGLYLVLDVAHKVLRTQTCWHIMNNLYMNHQNDMSMFRQAVTKAIVGSIVLTRYNNKTYRVDDILWDQNPMVKFKCHGDKMISYVDYYKEHYGIDIKDINQPLLFHRPKPKAKQSQTTPGSNGNGTDAICLMPELCFMTGLNDELRADLNVKKDLSEHTRLSPQERYKQLKNLIDSIRKNPKALEEMKKWGLDLEEDINRIEGRVLPLEKIRFLKKEVEIDYKCDWTRAVGKEEVLKAIEIRNWLCVYPNVREATVARFCEIAQENARRLGIRIAHPMIVPLRDDRPDSYYAEIKRRLDENVQIVVVVFPMLSDNRYQRVKRLCCIEYPVPSQIIVFKTINKPDQSLRSIAQKIVLQMNAKLGGELWSLSIPIKKIMIIGIDVYHKIEKGYKSIAGFVSSLNQEQTRWYSRVCFQMVGQELGDTLRPVFITALKKYQEVNGFKPDKIFIFRDGVSEGQLALVAEHEVAQLRSCFGTDYDPQMCVIVVQKRISTRIFSPKNNQSYENPRPGTIIDRGITSRDYTDFYLVSQNVNQGTVTPSHYIIFYDNTNMKIDHIQRLAYKMTHMYYNWSGTIRVPAPCQYAHKLAFLTGQYLQDEANEALCNRLFYL